MLAMWQSTSINEKAWKVWLACKLPMLRYVECFSWFSVSSPTSVHEALWAQSHLARTQCWSESPQLRIYIYILAYLNHSQPNNSGTGTQESCAHDPDIPAFLFEGDRQELLRTPVYHGGWWDETFAGLHLAMVSFLRWEHVRSLWFLHGQDAWLPALPSHFPFIPKIPQRGAPPGKQRGRQPFHQPGIA